MNPNDFKIKKNSKFGMVGVATEDVKKRLAPISEIIFEEDMTEEQLKVLRTGKGFVHI